jgi:hypothetical protein
MRLRQLTEYGSPHLSRVNARCTQPKFFSETQTFVLALDEKNASNEDIAFGFSLHFGALFWAYDRLYRKVRDQYK